MGRMNKNTLAVLALVITACGGAAVSPGTSSATPAAAVSLTPTPLAGTLTIFAAASLTESFNVLATEFTKQNPGLATTPNYAGSSGLVVQIINGAEADIF